MSAFSLEILNVTQCPFVNRKMGCLGTLKFLRNKISFECDITCFIDILCNIGGEIFEYSKSNKR